MSIKCLVYGFSLVLLFREDDLVVHLLCLLVMFPYHSHLLFCLFSLLCDGLLIFLCSILTAEFMRISIHNTGEIDVLILSSAKKRGSISSNQETGDEVSLIRKCKF